MEMQSPEVPIIEFVDATAFESWLDANGSDVAGVWIKIAKKSSGVPSVTSDEAIDVGLCFGWISGQRKSFDGVHYLQKYVPRRPRSRWSKINVDKVLELTAAGRMRPSGLAEVAAAQADGRWVNAYESQRNATIPPDLVAALEANAGAAEAFRRSNKTQQYAVILDIVTARTPKTRDARIKRAVAKLERATE